jgi:hypothetical protein
MAIIKGQSLRLFFASKVLAMATTCDVNISQVIRTYSNKDMFGGWLKQFVSAVNWSVNAECVICDDADYGVTVAELKEMIGTAVQVDFALASGSHNAVKGDVIVTGYAVITEVKQTAQKRQRSICNIQLTGAGKLMIPRLLADNDGVVLVTSDGYGLVVSDN